MKKILVAVAVLSMFVVPAVAKSDEEIEPPLTWQVALTDTSSPYATKPKATPKPIARASTTFRAYVTGYNTVPEQTDSTPCSAAGGNVCGRSDAVACPSNIKLHTWVVIGGKKYECMDRTAGKHNGRFDVSCDKDRACPMALTGWKTVTILDK